ADTLGGKSIDLLINNAGIFLNETLGKIDYDNIQQQFLINAEAPLRVTEALLGNLNTGAKIAFITSRMGSIADNGSGGYYGYRMSKAALNAAAMSLARDLKPRGIAVAILHPGFVQTAMVNFGGDISADESAQRLRQRIEGLTLDNSGTFWHSNGDVLPW
ncbi:MAG TPA: SDR family NAD(P)-dependent oxidoreductase, partial [Cellvibrio sp.]